MSAGFEFTMIAQGKIDGRIQIDPFDSYYDYAAGALLVLEAGGVVTNFGSDKYDFKNLNFVATNSIIYRELIKRKILD